jgi:hypothetical protein
MAQPGVYRAEHAMSSIWISADTPGLRKCMLEGRTATSHEWTTVLSDAKEQHRAWELKQTFFDHKKKKPTSRRTTSGNKKKKPRPRRITRRGRIFGPQHARPRGGGPQSKLFTAFKRSDSGKGGDEKKSLRSLKARARGRKAKAENAAKAAREAKAKGVARTGLLRGARRRVAPTQSSSQGRGTREALQETGSAAYSARMQRGAIHMLGI